MCVYECVCVYTILLVFVIVFISSLNFFLLYRHICASLVVQATSPLLSSLLVPSFLFFSSLISHSHYSSCLQMTLNDQLKLPDRPVFPMRKMEAADMPTVFALLTESMKK